MNKIFLKKILILILGVQLLIPGIALAGQPSVDCRTNPNPETFTHLCKNVDDILCKEVPDQIRRSCDERDKTIVHSEMTATEVYNFASGCLISAAKSFAEFFTVFLPDLCEAIWDLSKDAYEAATSPGFLSSLKGAYESAKSMATDVYEAFQKNPGEYFNEIWTKLIDSVSPLIQKYDCMSPQAKVEKICGVIGEWVMPPAILAKVIVRGTKAAKELIDLKLLSQAVKPKPVVSTVFNPSLGMDAFKLKFGKELQLREGANLDFIQKMEQDAVAKNVRTIYFDVENSVQKTLNDQVFSDKNAVDAINNSFFEKFNKNLSNHPELMSRLEGEYKDYKSYRIRLSLKPGDDPKKYEEMLASLYKKSNDDFINDDSFNVIAKNIPPRTDSIVDPSTWFLSGAGDNALEANMAARSSRKAVSENTGKPQLALFRSQADVLSEEVLGIEKLRLGLQSDKKLLSGKIMETAANGNIIPSKAMIGILRKIKPQDFATEKEFLDAIASKTKVLFGEDISADTSRGLALYFKKVDSLSPPLFVTKRVTIDLKQAEHGIVSVDFAGVGVDNIYEQMKALGQAGNAASAEKKLSQSFSKMQAGIDQVTKQMDDAKKVFDSAVAKIEKSDKKGTLFSGDDGIFMPNGQAWGLKEKTTLVSELAKSGDPSKFRVTFVSSHYSDGKVIPPAERSKRIVRAENLEKEMRSKFVGIKNISDSDAKKIISAIDYTPNEKGGVFNLILSGKKFSADEIKSIEDAFKKSIESEAGESIGKVIVN